MNDPDAITWIIGLFIIAPLFVVFLTLLAVYWSELDSEIDFEYMPENRETIE